MKDHKCIKNVKEMQMNNDECYLMTKSSHHLQYGEHFTGQVIVAPSADLGDSVLSLSP